MQQFLSCPKCQARLRAPANTTQTQVRCGGCGHVFAVEGPPDEALDAILLEDEPKEMLDALPADDEPLPRPPQVVRPPLKEPSPSAGVAGCLFHLLALTPLGIAALGALFCRFGTGWIGGLVWGALGSGLALTCVGLVRRTQWSWLVRLLGSLGLAGGGYLLLLIALGVSFWQWWHRIDPADWRDFSPPGGRFHVSVPGTPVPQAPPPGLQMDVQAYALELRRQDIAFAISFGEIPPWERGRVPLEFRFNNSLAGMQARMPGSQMVAQKDITLDGSPGREFHLRIPGKGIMVGRVYIVGNRIYVLLIAGSRITPDADEVRTFFDSFHPDPIDPKEIAPPPPENVIPPPQPPKKEKPKGPDSDDEKDDPARKIIGKAAQPVIHLTLARDGHTVAVACENGVIELWDLDRGRRQAELRVQNPTVPGGANDRTWLRTALSPDGKTLVVGTMKGDIQLFDAATGKSSAVLLPAVVPDTTTDCLAFSPSGRYLASGHSRTGLGLGSSAIIRLWDVLERRLLRTISDPFKWRAATLAFTPDGSQIVSGSNFTSELHWFDCATGERLKQFKLDSPAQAVAITADGGKLAVSDSNRAASLWDVKSGASRVIFTARDNLAAMDLSPNGKFVATATVDGDLRLTETNSGKTRWEKPRLRGNPRTALPAVAFTSDGKRLLICRHGRLDLWQVDKMIQATPDELAEPNKRPALAEPQPTPGEPVAGIVAYVPTKKDDFRLAVSSLELSADGKTLITANMYPNVRFWDLATGKMRAEVADIDPVALSASPTEPSVAVADVFAIHLYDSSTGRKLGDLEPNETEILALWKAPNTSRARVGRVAFAPDGKTLAVAYLSERSAVIELWDMATKKVTRRFVTETGIGHMAFSPDGRTLATCLHNDILVRLYDVATGKLFLRLKGIEWGASNVAFSGDGKYVAAAGTGSPMVLVWDAHTGRGVKYFRDRETKFRGLYVAFSPDGKTLASSDNGGNVLVYDMASRKLIGRFASATRIMSLTFTRDNRTLIAGTVSGWVDLWNVGKLPRPKPPDESVVEKPADKPAVSGADLQPAGTIEPFLSAVVDPKAGRMLTLGWDRFLRVYSYPAFQFERAYWLGATAYQAVLDRERGLLYAAVCDPPALEHKKDKHNWRHSVTVGPADLHVYDVKKILAGEKLSDYMLRPTKMIPLKEPLRHLLITPDHRWIYYLTDDGKEPSRVGRIDATAHGKDQERKIEHSSGELHLSLDGKTLYAGRGSGDPKQKKGFVEVFDAATMKPQRTIETPFVPAQIADGGGRLFVGCGDAPLALLDTKDGRSIIHTRFDFPRCDGYLRVGSASGRLYSVSPTMRSIECYDFTSGAPAGRPQPEEKLSDKGDGSLVSDALVTPDGKYLLFKAGGVVRLAVPGVNRPLPEPPQVEPRPIDAKGWREHKPLADLKKGFMHALAFTPDGSELAIGGTSGHIYYHDRESGKVRESPSGSGIAYMAFQTIHKTVVCSFFTRSASVHSIKEFPRGGDARNLSGYGLDSVAFVPNNAELVVAGGEQGKELVFWSTLSGSAVVKNIRDFPNPLTAVALYADDKRWAAGNIHLAAGSIAGPVYQVTVENQGKGAKPSERRALIGHKAEVRCVAFAPGGKLLASAGVDRTVKLWDAATGKGMHTLSGHQHVVLCISFSPDSKLLASGGADGVVRVWDVATGAIRATMVPRRPDAMVFALAFAPDGKTLAAACGAEVRQWDASK